jgi:Family of unknown function (DUF6194)
MTEEELLDLLRSLPGTTVVTASEASGAPAAAWGDSFALYDPDGDLPPARQRPFTTVVVRDVPGWDVESRLDRAGVFRVNIDVGSRRYAELLGHPTAEYAQRRDAYGGGRRAAAASPVRRAGLGVDREPGAAHRRPRAAARRRGPRRRGPPLAPPAIGDHRRDLIAAGSGAGHGRQSCS